MISLEGMYDIHVHPAPSIQKRKFTALEALKFAEEEKMAGIMLLDHTYNTTAMADTINEIGFKAKAFGTVMLNEGVGGLNPSVVEVALSLGTKQIQMPTYSSKHHQDSIGDLKIFPYKKRAKPVYILDNRGHLIPEVQDILDLVKDANAFIGTGHLSSSEVDILVKRTNELGCRIVVNSVSTDSLHSLEAQKNWTGDMTFIEHDYNAVSDLPKRPMPIGEIVNQIRAIGAERCVIGSDAGSMKLPTNTEAMRKFSSMLLEAGLTDKELDLISRRVPKILLGVS